jgi:hypothetical protein
VFGETPALLSDPYLEGLLACTAFWVNAALESDTVVGGPDADTLIVAAPDNTEAPRFVYGTVMSSGRSGLSPDLVQLPSRADRKPGSTRRCSSGALGPMLV